MSNIDKLLYIDGLGEITQNLNIGGNINLTETLFTKKLGIGTSNIASSDVFHITGDTTVQGHIIPSNDNTYTLGSTTKAFKDVYVGPGSLYINNKKILGEHETESNTINITTDTDEHIQINTNGTGLLKLQSENNNIQLIIKENKSGSIEIKKNTGGSGNISLTNSGINGNISLINEAAGNIVLTQSGLGDINITNSNSNSNSNIEITTHGGNISLSSSVTNIDGILEVDTINEKTSNVGVTIDSVLLKDGNITGELIGNADTATKIASITNDNIVQLTNTQTLNNKTLISPVINTSILNVSNRTMFGYAGTRLTIGSTVTDTVYINRCSNILTPENESFMEHETNSITIGNSTDILTLFSAGKTLTLPTNSGTIALTSDITSGGGSSVWTQSGNNAYYTSGNVGIGVSSPVVGLHVKGNGDTANRVEIESSGETNPVLQFKKPTNKMAYIFYNGSVIEHSPAFSYNSDDRIKENETLILNSINTILKLRPQAYIKKLGIMSINEINNNTESIFEAGLIAQEIYYEVPELRHLVSVPSDAILIDDNKYKNFTDIKNDPDYNNWGNNIASVNYTGLIPYLIRGIQEQQEEINTLKQENIELKSIVDKLKTANSFEEFKNLL